ncbi:MAG: phospholipase [Flavobacteriales bacterium]|nr:phospholipase [Flavobacteriales bacterium]
MEERFIQVQRTARYHVLGTLEASPEIWVVIHGYGQLARYFLNTFKGLEQGRCFVAPEGLSRFYLDAEHSRVGATWMTREDRLHEIDDHVAYLDALCDELRKQAMPGARICALGFSQGVATLMRWAVLGRTNINRLVLWGGSLPPDLDGERLKARLSNATVHLVHGTNDSLVPERAMHDGTNLLKRHGIACTTATFAGGHELDRIALSEALPASR